MTASLLFIVTFLLCSASATISPEDAHLHQSNPDRFIKTTQKKGSSSTPQRTTATTDHDNHKTENSNMSGRTTALKRIPNAMLGVSEPNPRMFGNGPNERLPNWSNENWLKSRFHFSFAEYHNPRNNNFGVLRVMNDDLVQAKRGFGQHPHRDAEICTYVVKGELTHADSMGTRETLGAGAIQFMSAGSGVVHSEHNIHPTNPLRFIQIWITPRARGLEPNYGSFDGGDAADRKDKWAHLVGPSKAAIAASPSAASAPFFNTAKVHIEQDANIYVTELSGPNAPIAFEVKQGRQAYLLCISGPATVTVTSGGSNSAPLETHDAAELGTGAFSLEATTAAGAHFLVVEMAYAAGGRGDI